VADLTIKEDIKKLINETIASYGKLDVLVNNAGIAGITDIEEDGVEDKYERIMNTNSTALVLLCHYSVPYLKKTKGNIVSVSSVASIKPVSDLFYSYFHYYVVNYFIELKMYVKY
jgi:NAD(P)-dependent dehydrogenase (short-subunit alcohol dehydrogenase family)